MKEKTNTKRMNRKAYRKYLTSAWWKARRLVALELSDYCEQCKSKISLQVHHKTYARLGEEKNTDLLVLCQRCHEKVHLKKHQRIQLKKEKHQQERRNRKEQQPKSKYPKEMSRALWKARPKGMSRALWAAKIMHTRPKGIRRTTWSGLYIRATSYEEYLKQKEQRDSK